MQLAARDRANRPRARQQGEANMTKQAPDVRRCLTIASLRATAVHVGPSLTPNSSAAAGARLAHVLMTAAQWQREQDQLRHMALLRHLAGPSKN